MVQLAVDIDGKLAGFAKESSGRDVDVGVFDGSGDFINPDLFSSEFLGVDREFFLANARPLLAPLIKIIYG